jgi:hypothetical protein
MAVIANYAFDSVPQDLFAVRDGRLFESRVTTFSNPTSSSGARSLPISSLFFSRRHVPADASYYSNSRWNQILADYAASLSNGEFLFPTAALAAVESLAEASDGRLLLLSADKGFVGDQGFLRETALGDMELHGGGGCLSLQVNYNAIHRLITLLGGAGWFRESSAHTLAMFGGSLGLPTGRHTETEIAFRKSIEGFTPEDFCQIIQVLGRDARYASLAEVLSALRFSGYDSLILLRLMPRLLELASRASEDDQAELAQAVERVWDRYYAFDSQEDLAFELGIVLLEIGRFQRAAEFFTLSGQQCGASPAMFYNLGMARNGLGDAVGALDAMEQCLALDAEFEAARLMRLKLQGAIRSVDLLPATNGRRSRQTRNPLQKRMARGTSGTG